MACGIACAAHDGRFAVCERRVAQAICHPGAPRPTPDEVRAAFAAQHHVDFHECVINRVGLRVPEEQEREGLDVNSHGENAYNA